MVDFPRPLSVEELCPLVQSLRGRLSRQRQDAVAIDSWLRPDAVTGFRIPDKAGREHEQLAALARTPWLGLVVTNVAQAMYVDNVVSETGEDPALWKLWVSNGMPAAQVSNHRAMVGYGQSFAVVTPAVLDGVETARIRCLSMKRMAVEWVDPATDVYPAYALEALSPSGGNSRWRFYDSHYRYSLADGGRTGEYRLEALPFLHGVGATPVVRFANMLDLDGNVTGEVAPFIPTAARINKTSYDRLLAQHFNSWKTRTISGIDLPENEDPGLERLEAEATKLKLAQDDILISEDPDTKFGVLDGTSLDTYVAAWRSDIEALAAVSQTPAHALTGQLVNLNAEALAAARAPLTQKVWERQVNAGQSYSRVLRLAASIAGLEEQAKDPLVRVTWQDMEIRSMSQAVDALGKAAVMLGIPKRGLWGRIPGVERSDLQAWEMMAREDLDADPLNAVLRRHSQDTETPADVSGEA